MAKRLTEHHPLTQKLRKLEAFMEELGIGLEWNGYQMVVSCQETKEEALLLDQESGKVVIEVPSHFESKLIRYDIEYCLSNFRKKLFNHE